jgi:starch synthase (maltosyl-transferring)
MATRTKTSRSAAAVFKLANLPPDGRIRVAIERVSPELDGGRFPIKAVPGDVIAVEADIFLDGHDKLAARLLYKHPDDPAWSEVPMVLINNDRWGASFSVEKPGRYLYTIEGWVDHIASWQYEVGLKVRDNQRITSELKAGAVYAEGMAQRAEGDDKPTLEWVAGLFKTGSDDDSQYDEAIRVAQSEQFTDLFNRYPERQHPARYGQELVVDVDRPIAGFSTWYCLFPRSTSQELNSDGMPVHGTFRDVEKLLPRLESLGFDVLYLPPIHPIGNAFRKGKNNNVVSQPGEPGVPYGIGSELGGHTAIHPELGTLDDFKHLIAIARNHGMELAMDLAIQVSPDHRWAKDHPYC